MDKRTQAHNAYKKAKQISFKVQNSRSPADMRKARDAWERFRDLTDNQHDQDTARFQIDRYDTLSHVGTQEWANLRGVIAGEKMAQQFGGGLELQGAIDVSDIQNASEDLALVPKARRPSQAPAKLAPMNLVLAYYRGYNFGLRNY